LLLGGIPSPRAPFLKGEKSPLLQGYLKKNNLKTDWALLGLMAQMAAACNGLSQTYPRKQLNLHAAHGNTTNIKLYFVSV
jgi:hypothetical protein